MCVCVHMCMVMRVMCVCGMCVWMIEYACACMYVRVHGDVCACVYMCVRTRDGEGVSWSGMCM